MDSKALVTIKQNRYSVPVRLAGLRVHARVGAREIECHHGGELVAVHERQQGRFGVAASLDHYLELLARKPGALAGSLALSQERERGCLALGLRRAVGEDHRALWRLGGRAADGRRAAARPRAQLPVRSSKLSVALWPRAPTTGARSRFSPAVVPGPSRESSMISHAPAGLGAPPPTLGHYDELLVAGGAR